MRTISYTISRLGYLSAAVLGAVACADASSPAAFSVTDSAGVRIIESQHPEWVGDRGWRVSQEPILQIGERDGDEAVQFFGLTGGLQMSDGRIVVLNSGSNTVRVFSEAGEFITEFGGPGDGPGEFKRLASIHCLPGDTLLVWDPGRPGFSLFTASGEFIRSQRLTPPGPERIAEVVPLPDGSLVVKTYAGALTPGGDQGVGIRRDSAPLLLLSREGEFLDTIGVFPSTESVIMEMGGRTLVGVPPFPKTTWIDVHGSSIFVGSADAMEVSVLSPAGKEEAVFRYPSVDLAVAQEDKDWFADRMAEAASTPQEQQMLGLVLEALVFPDTRAAYSGLRLDQTGAVWLRSGRHYPPVAPSTEWTVFSEEGVLLGTLSLPERFEVFEFGDDHVLGVWKDEMDVEFVRIYSLEGRARN